jgi:hypothetical protein
MLCIWCVPSSQTQGPEYQIELGRRDGLSSYQDNAQTHLPGFYLNVSGLLDSFNNAGLDIVDLVVLSGLSSWISLFSSEEFTDGQQL